MCKKLCNFGTVPPIFENWILTCARDVKEKSHVISTQNIFALKDYCETCRGGGGGGGGLNLSSNVHPGIDEMDNNVHSVRFSNQLTKMGNTCEFLKEQTTRSLYRTAKTGVLNLTPVGVVRGPHQSSVKITP